MGFIARCLRRAAVYYPLLHLIFPYFLSTFAAILTFPSLTDITVDALCASSESSCDTAIYTTGISTFAIGFGTMMITPIVGGLSDDYGRKPLLLVAFSLQVIPYAVLAVSVSTRAVYAYYIAKSLVGMVTDGTTLCLILALVADVIPEPQRPAAFGVTMSAFSVAFFLAPAISRLLPIYATFDVSVLLFVAAVVYIALFLPETAPRHRMVLGRAPASGTAATGAKEGQTAAAGPGQGPAWSGPRLKRSPSQFRDTMEVVGRSPRLTRLALIVFCYNLSEGGMTTGLFLYLKEMFHYTKDDYALFLLVIGVCSMVSQLILLPTFVHWFGTQATLLIGLFFVFLHGVLYGIAWAYWVPFAAAGMASCTFFVFPTVSSMVSAMALEDEQGKVQGVVTGVRSLATALAPLIFSPLLAYFMSPEAAIDLPGFSFLVASVFSVVAFILGATLPPPPPRMPDPPSQVYGFARPADVDLEENADAESKGGFQEPLLEHQLADATHVAA